MKYKILKSNCFGKIYFTEEELCQLLEEVYADGIVEGKTRAERITITTDSTNPTTAIITDNTNPTTTIF